MSKFANRSPFGTSQRTAYGISSGPSPSRGGAATGGGAPSTSAPAPANSCSSWPASRNVEEPTPTTSPSDSAARDALAMDEGAGGAAQVHDAVHARHVAQLGMVAGDGRVGDHDVVIRRPADAQRPARQRPGHARLAGRRDRLAGRPDRLWG